MENEIKFLSELVEKSTISANELGKNHWQIKEALAKKIKQFLVEENYIHQIKFDLKQNCKIDNNKILCSIDGGRINPKIATSDPYAIRVVTTRLSPAKKLQEIIPIYTKISDIYDKKDNLYDELKVENDEIEYALNQKKKDAALKIAEISALNSLVFKNQEFNFALIHGPIQPIVLGFSDIDFPSFTSRAYKEFLPFINDNDPNKMTRHFIKACHDSLHFLKDSKKGIYGCVERPRSGLYINYFLKRILDKGKITRSDFHKLLATRKRYDLHDQTLFDLILEKDQFLEPLLVSKQTSLFGAGIAGRINDQWSQIIDNYPDTYISYMKPGQDLPFRIESLVKNENYQEDYRSILHQSRIVPGNGFPMILHVADFYAKIPNHMRNLMIQIHEKQFLKDALDSKNEKRILSSLKTIGFNKRSWFKRPHIL
tara:strand:- start:2598 stop:3878 length:1281 start_codon:yes stop_codon:yes gene_type:complete